jgi:hypothetical protein
MSSGRARFRDACAGACERLPQAAGSKNDQREFIDDEDTDGLPAGQQQAGWLRDFPGPVASRVDAIFPERPCGRVLGAASSERLQAKPTRHRLRHRVPSSCDTVLGRGRYYATTFRAGDDLLRAFARRRRESRWR